MELALQGIRILDMSRVAVPALATMILGDFGADVIKVETPRKTPGPYLGSSVSPLGKEGEREAAYRAINRNKKSIALDLRSPAGKQIFYKLAETADVIVEGFRPGVVKRLGVDYESIRRINSRIVYCSISGYGQDGPYRDFPGHDTNYISIGGALGLIGYRDRPPVLPLNFIGDWAGGSLHSTIGILIALLAREKTGQGQYVDISMTDGVISLMTLIASDYFMSGVIPKRQEIMINGAFPWLNVYETKDGGFISLGCLEPHFWENLCRALGREDFIPYQWDEGQKREEIFSYFRQIFLTKTREEWLRDLRQYDIPVTPVYELDEVFRDPQVIHRNMVIELDHPSSGKVRQLGIAIKLSNTPGGVRNMAPTLGRDTDGVLLSLGYTTEDIQSWREQEIIQ